MGAAHRVPHPFFFLGSYRILYRFVYSFFVKRMKSFLDHLQVNIDTAHAAFYKELMTLMGWTVIFEQDGMAGYKSEQNGSLWFLKATDTNVNNYNAPGGNHIGIKVEKMNNVDEVATYLKAHGIPALFDTPRHRPEFAASETETYYQVMFESPDRILFEVIYAGPKA